MEWIVPNGYQKLSPNRYWTNHKPEYIKPVEAFIYHYTASIGTSGTLSWLIDPTAQASAHFLVARDGTIWQLVSLLERSWHAGGKTSKLFGQDNVNGRTIGIEIMNVGPLYEKNGVIWTVAENKKFVGPGASAGGPPKYQYTMWEAYPPTQIAAVTSLTQKLLVEFPNIKQDPINRMIGHEDVDPTRKTDPGPVFPWEQIRALAA